MNKIAIHSVPRSGSSWLGQIINSSPDVCFRFQPFFSYAFKDYLDENCTKSDIDRFYSEISISKDDFLLQSDKIEDGTYPRFTKTDDFKHVAYKEVRYHHILDNMLKQQNALKVIGLIRSPFAVINSFLRAPREFRLDLGWDQYEEWRSADKKNLGRKEEFFGYNKWKEVALLFRKLQHEYPEQFYLANYNTLLSEPHQETNRIFGFCDIEVTEQTYDFLNASMSTTKKTDVYSVYNHRKRDDAWKIQLDKQIVSEILKDISDSGLEEYA